MKPTQLAVPYDAISSFSIRKDTVPDINNRWHFHTEVELICFHKGAGTQFVGDHIKRFEPGDIVLVGSNLPHYWRYDNLSETDSSMPYSTVVHFNENFLGEKFLCLPEVNSIKALFEKAKRGIWIKEQNLREKVLMHVEKIYQSNGLYKILALLECLMCISLTKHPALLSSIGFKYEHREVENERLNTIYDFSIQNFRKKLFLDEVAALINLTPTSFCRYFKSRTGKTYSQFLIEIRIGYACRLLLENKLTVKEICFESGFNNFTSFHETFKSITGKTPKTYQGQHQIL